MDALEKKPARRKVVKTKKNEVVCNINEVVNDKEIKYSTEVRVKTRRTTSDPNISEKQTQEKTNTAKQRRLRKKRAQERLQLVSTGNSNKLTDSKSENHCKKVRTKTKKLATGKGLDESNKVKAKKERIYTFSSEITSSIPKQSGPNIKMETKLEKSREDVIAEREAKKLAKQLAKTKKVTKAPPTKTPEEAERCKGVEAEKPQHKTNQSKPVQKQERTIKNDAAAGDVKQTSQKVSIKINPEKVVKGITAVRQDTVKLVQVDEKKTEEKSKSDLRAERRAKQEAQRAAKTQAADKAKDNTKINQKTTEVTISTTKPQRAKVTPPITVKPKVSVHKVKLFNHLYAEREENAVKVNLNSSEVHPAIIRLGVQYANGVVVGSNARCIALLNALKQVINEYVTPPQKEFSRGLEASLQPCMEYLHQCRPVSVSMTNALRYLKRQINQLENNISDAEAKERLQETIDTYYEEQIHKAAEGISNTVQGKIVDGDVILTYGCSSLIQTILEDAHKKKQFRVVIVEGRPLSEGKEMLRRLVDQGISCSYVLINAASFIMGEVTKVLLGAHALLANGYVMSRVGTAQVAMVAQSYNVPVLVCCETHKFIERVQTDSFVYNEIGDPNELVNANILNRDKPLALWKSMNYLTPLNLKYDVTPPELVTAVVTEVAILPCTSVPVILRIKPSDF